MEERIEKPKIDYKFNNPSDTSEILYAEILKIGLWKFDYKKKREKKEKWYYQCRNDFEKNIALLFQKFIPFTCVHKEENENKDKYLELIIEEFENFKRKTNLLEVINNRNKNWLKSLENSGLKVCSFSATCEWRLVIGLGSAHPQETSMTLHHIYGIPYIPGSAIKGITRHWYILQKFNEFQIGDFNQIKCLEKILETARLENKDETKRDDKLSKKEFKEKFKAKLENKQIVEPADELYNFLTLKQEEIKNFQKVFGTQQKKGEVIFFDAFPVEDVKLKMDIMNPHYPQYYSGNEAPADWQNPNPIKFLTVKNTKFQFYLASRDKTLLKDAEKLLKNALKEHGIGAKTALGYGIFNI